MSQSHKWKDATELEIKQLHDYQRFIDHGVFGKDSPPASYQKLQARLIYDVKHDR